MYDTNWDFVISSSKTPVTFTAHLGNIPQDHDSMFTVASMFRCKTSVYRSQCIPGQDQRRSNRVKTS